MGLRLMDTTSTGDVIPLPMDEMIIDDASHEDAPLPEPARLYGLIVLALLLHTPHPVFGGCTTCSEHWPCTQVRLAFRLREGF